MTMKTPPSTPAGVAWILAIAGLAVIPLAGHREGQAARPEQPDVLTAHFEFPACPVTWRHRLWGSEEYTPETSNGITFFGERETIFVTDNRIGAWPPPGRGTTRRFFRPKDHAFHVSP